MPKAFSVSSLCFDHTPSDSELTGLVGKMSWYGRSPTLVPLGAKCVENSGMSMATPRRLPTVLLVLLAVVGDVVFTYLVIRQEATGFSWWSMVWIWIFPIGLWCYLFFFNRCLCGRDDLFRVDHGRRTLELCRIGRTFKASEIVAFVDLTRWHRRYRVEIQWYRIRQTAVLTRSPSRQIELYPMIHDIEIPVLWMSLPLFRQVPWGERLANMFLVPLRRISLNQSESRALNDC